MRRWRSFVQTSLAVSKQQQQHSLRVVHRVTKQQQHKPDVHTQLPLQVVFEDLKAIADLIEKEVSREEGQVQLVQPEHPRLR